MAKGLITSAAVAIDLAEFAMSLDLEADQLMESAKLGHVASAAQAQRLKNMAKRLNSTTLRDTLDGMTPMKAQSAQRRSQSKGFMHPFHAMLNERGVTVPEAAAKLGVLAPVAYGWLRKKQVRTVPEDVTKRAQKIWGFAPTPENWPNGIRKKD